MKTPITGAARSVSDFGERTRKLFKDNPIAIPTPIQRKSFGHSKRPTKPAPAEDAPKADEPSNDAA